VLEVRLVRGLVVAPGSLPVGVDHLVALDFDIGKFVGVIGLGFVRFGWFCLEHFFHGFFDFSAALFADDGSAASCYGWPLFGVLGFAG